MRNHRPVPSDSRPAAVEHGPLSGHRRQPVGAVIGLFALLALGCDGGGYIETGDLPALRAQGQLRILVPRRGEAEVLPRHGHPFDHERRLAAEMAGSIGLEPVFVWVERHDDLIPALIEGRGDLVAANFTVTPERETVIAFSRPVGRVREQLIARTADGEIDGPEDLAGRRVVVRRSSSYWHTLERVRQRYPEIELAAAPEDMDTEEIIYRVATGEFDLTAADDNLAVEVLAYTPDLRVAFDLTPPRPVAWGLRPGAPQLKATVDRFIARANLGGRRPQRYRADLPGIREKRVLRVLTRNSASTYYVWRGELVGFEYDLARRFADRIGTRIEIIVAPTRAALLSWLRQGHGDLVAAGLTRTEERAERGVAFSRPYNYAREVVVARAGDTTIDSLANLAGRTLVVRRSSSYWNTVERLRDGGIEVRLEAAPESLETEEIIARVANDEYDLTVADSHILDVELTWRDDVRAALPLGDSVAHGWVVRETDRRLKAAIDSFFREEYRGLFYNVTYNKYFRDAARVRERVGARPRVTGAVSPYDGLIRSQAQRHGFDWLLIAAQMYQESRFDPEARSFAGAVGLMQVLPSTARELGIENPQEVEAGIEAGVTYLRHLYDRVDGARSEQDRLWFALAAYNAGFGHLLDARRLARRLGRDDTMWFGEVAEVMPVLARAEYHRRARYGYCRCGEPVRYVRAIRQLYQAYRAALTERADD